MSLAEFDGLAGSGRAVGALAGEMLTRAALPADASPADAATRVTAARGATPPGAVSRDAVFRDAVFRDALSRDALSRVDPAAPPDPDLDRESGAPQPAARTRSRLSVAPVAVTTPAPRRLPFVLTLVTLLMTGLGGLLVLNTVMAQDSFRASHLAEQSALLQAQRQALSEQVDRLQSPQSLADRAARLGLQPQTDPPILDLGTGKVTATRR